MSIKGQVPANFEFRALQVFVTAAEQGGMTKAARVLGLTQSAVSQTIASLEDAVGKQLFDRAVRPIVLTGAGHALFAHGQRILGDVRQAYIEASEIDRGELAALSIGMPESLANVLGPRLYRRRPGLAKFWRITNGLTPDQRARFNSHAADLMITEESNISDMLEIERHLLFTEPYVLIFPKDFDLPTELGPHLAERRFIRFSLRSSAGRQTEAQLNRLQLKFSAEIEFDSVSGHAMAVADGLGWGITTPLCLFQVPGIFDALQVCPIARGSFGRRMTLISRADALGATPAIVAAECRAILRDEVFPQLTAAVPWLDGTLTLGESAARL
jgi:DNA-binding transcriptional LysR family regulator